MTDDQATANPQSKQDSILPCGRPLEASDPPDRTFEIGLVLAGAISAGAYTAGVIDFLIEALDAWERAKASERQAKGDDTTKWSIPAHDVRIKAIAGASAGSIVGAIAGAALRYDFPHIDAIAAGTPAALANPLFRAWVNDIDIAKLLGTRDLDQNPDKVVSILDSTPLVDIARTAMDYRGQTILRPYLTDPLHLIFVVNNLRGIPYSIDMRGNAATGHEMTSHADQMRFAVTGLGGGVPQSPYRDESMLVYPNSAALQNWMSMATAALASGAFPFGLQPRELSRSRDDMVFRYVALPGNAAPLWAQIKPSWPDGTEINYRFLNVDGGTLDNEPIELARIELAGLLGRNPRGGLDAKRAVILVDPFPDPAELGPESDRGLLKTGLSILGAWKNQARFKPVDLALASDATVYSRYLVSPSRSGDDAVSNGFAIASGALGGLSGFLRWDYRCHDYLLGRRNCQRFLSNHLTLLAGNHLFDGWEPSLKTDPRFAVMNAAGATELPVIPFVGALNPVGGNVEGMPAWPAASLTGAGMQELQDRIGHRLDAVVNGLLSGQNLALRIVLKLAWKLGASSCVDYIVNVVAGDLKKRNLYR
jgi:predicted acylesterase/phospholipase RssA